MKKDRQLSKTKDKSPRLNTLPLLRGMFICPEPVKRLKNISGSVLLHDFFSSGDLSSFEYAGE